MVQQFPPTPPAYFDSYSGGDGGASQLPALRLASSQAIPHQSGRRETRDFPSQYSQYAPAPALRPMFPQENTRSATATYAASSHGSSTQYTGGGVPMLPPIRIPDRLHMDDFHQHVPTNRAPTVAHPKEEKAVGGVAAHLDYEMEDMVDFVAQTAQGMYDIYASKICLADIDIARSVLSSKFPVHPDLRKYVSQVLSSTRLPSSTIFLGLYYLAKRMTLLSANGSFNHGGGQVYRMLTIGLLLGSKFLDDNTFQNRSWSEVSNIPVLELNSLEQDWLSAIQWNMHFDPQDPEGFDLWCQQWKTFLAFRAAKVADRAAKMADQALLQSMKDTHLNNNSRRPGSVTLMSPPSSGDLPSLSVHTMGNGLNALPQPQWATPRYDPWQSSRLHNEYSPPSAPETGPATPEWYGSHNMLTYGQGHQQIYPPIKMPPPLQVVGSSATQSGYSTPYTTQNYSNFGHGTPCTCPRCVPQYNRYSMALGNFPQSAIG